MKDGIHPQYVDCVITCACGNVVHTRATVPELKVEICSNCHPFFTGKQKFVDTAGRVEKFQRRYNWGISQESQAETADSSTGAETSAEAAPAGET